jgi:hypothetical protein
MGMICEEMGKNYPPLARNEHGPDPQTCFVQVLVLSKILIN